MYHVYKIQKKKTVSPWMYVLTYNLRFELILCTSPWESFYVHPYTIGSISDLIRLVKSNKETLFK